MPGIAGIWRAAGAGDGDALCGMLDALAHRGPAGAAVHREPASGLALGVRGRAPAEPDSAGQAPPSLGGRYWIVQDGQLHNHREIGTILEAQGRPCRPDVCAEVVLAAYARWGAACLERFRGTFSFAIWDAEQRELFLARDRFGVQPLYYVDLPGAFLFASEIQALLASRLVSRAADPGAVREYLAYGAIPQPATILRQVRALPPGHWMRVRAGERVVQPYWDLEEATRRGRRELAGIGYDDATARLRELLEEAVGHHLAGDRTTGAFLSGGIDSTAVVGLMSRLANRPVRTFAVGFETQHAHLDELRWAKRVADRFGSDHTEVVVTAEDAARSFDDLLAAIDQPSIDGTNTFFAAAAAGQSLEVALSGLGGDELFAGYPHFRRIARGERLAPRGLATLHRALCRNAGRLPGRISVPLRMVAASPIERLASVRRLLAPGELPDVAAPGLLAGAAPDEVARRLGTLLRDGLDVVQQVSYVELNAYLRDTLLRDADAMGMAHSLEVRPVLLDHVLAELAFSLPGHFKLSGSRTKRILVDALRDLLPAEVVSRRKMGFELPLMHWLHTSLRPRALDLLGSRTARSLFAPAFLEAMRHEIRSASSQSNRTWAYVILSGYCERLRVEVEGEALGSPLTLGVHAQT